MITYQQDTFQAILPEFKVLLKEHMAEMNYFQMHGAEFDPNYDMYMAANEDKKLRLITAKDDGALIGYIAFGIGKLSRYQNTIVAREDIYYVKPEYRHRGIATKLFYEAERVLERCNVDFMVATTKMYHDRSGLLEKSGYELFEKVFAKRLRKIK